MKEQKTELETQVQTDKPASKPSRIASESTTTTQTATTKTATNSEKESVPFYENRLVILTCGVIVMIVYGLIYAWSIFVPALEEEFGWIRTQTSVTFSVSMALWSCGMLVNGELSKKISQRSCYCVGAGLVIIGFLLCRFITHLWQLYVFYGVFCGFGAGLCYNLWTSSTVAHFPDKVGFANGTLLMGFGMGSMILGSTASALISSIGWRNTFTVLAVITAVVAGLGMPFLRKPQAFEIAKKRSNQLELTGSQMIKEPSFWLFNLWKVLAMGTAAAIIAQASVIMIGIGAKMVFATVAVGMLSIGNGCGRPVMGTIYDKIGQEKTLIVLSGAGIIIGIGLYTFYLNSLLVPMAVCLFCEGVLYGGYAAINTAFVRTTYGQDSYPMNLGIASFTLMPFNFVMPIVAAAIFDASGSYTYFFLLVPLIQLISLVGGLTTNPSVKRMNKRYAKKATGDGGETDEGNGAENDSQ